MTAVPDTEMVNIYIEQLANELTKEQRQKLLISTELEMTKRRLAAANETIERLHASNEDLESSLQQLEDGPLPQTAGRHGDPGWPGAKGLEGIKPQEDGDTIEDGQEAFRNGTVYQFDETSGEYRAWTRERSATDRSGVAKLEADVVNWNDL